MVHQQANQVSENKKENHRNKLIPWKKRERKVNSTFNLVKVGFNTRMVTRWPEATAMRLSSDQAMALGKEGAPKSIAGCNELGQERVMLWFFEEQRHNNQS